MHLGTVHMHVELKLLADCFDVLETFLVIGSSSANPDLDFVFIERGGKFPQGTDDTLER